MSAIASQPVSLHAPAVPASATRGGIEQRKATRVKRMSPAQLIFWPSSPRSQPIDVTVVDYSLTGIGIISGETLPPGQKFVVREPFVTSGATCIYTVVRSDKRGDGTYSIGLHVGNTVEDNLEPSDPPPATLDRRWQFLYFLFALVGTVLVISMTLLKHLW